MTANKMHFYGLDLGQAADYTAEAILEFDAILPGNPTQNWEPVYALRHLHRYHLGTRYTEITKAVIERLQNPALRYITFAVDGTGGGRPVVDMIRKEIESHSWRDKTGFYFYPVTVTAGHQATVGDDGYWHVPKRDLVGSLQLLLQSRRLQIAESLPHAKQFVHELENFKIKITAAKNETFECLTAGTMVETSAGSKPIESVCVGEFVLTRQGYKKVLWAGPTKRVDRLACVTFDNGQVLCGTPDHLVWTETRGWVPLADLGESDSCRGLRSRTCTTGARADAPR
jgi:Hint domain